LSLVTETIAEPTMAGLRAARDRATAADLVELRLDFVEDLDVAGALAGRTRPAIVTCRAAWEGGRFGGSEEERLRILSHAVALGAEYVDLEWRADRSQVPVREGTTRVVSFHDHEGMPRDVAGHVRAMCDEPQSIVKIAVTARRLRDCVTLRDAVRDLDHRHVAIAMGSVGQLTRLCPWIVGSEWTYGGTAASGQTSTGDLIDTYRVRTTGPASEMFAVAGAPLGHSASPAMHNAALAACGMDGVYIPLETADADELLSVAEALGVRGISVTAPLKTGVFARATHRDELSTRVGAVNTLRRTANGWEGANFDAAGFLAPLDRRGHALEGTRAVVLGAGGAARTVAWALASRGAHVEISARRRERADRVAGELGVTVGAWPPAAGWDLLVNTTPVGTWPETAASPIAASHVRGGTVYDLIYNPAATQLMTVAEGSGLRAIGGLEMLVSQAGLQFNWWTGREAPEDVMARAAREFIDRGTREPHEAHHV